MVADLINKRLFKNGNEKILKEQNINVLKIQVYQKIQLKNGGTINKNKIYFIKYKLVQDLYKILV